jgi:prevent-host-death family protein
MEVIAVGQLRKRLGEYLERAHEGEHLIITDRGREIAQLVPVGESKKSTLRLREPGTVAWSGRKPAGLRGVVARGEPLADTVLRERR